MSVKRNTWTITTRHPAGYRDGEHTVTVEWQKDGTRCVSGGGFGCSRDYYASDDIIAIKMLLAENGMVLVSCKPS